MIMGAQPETKPEGVDAVRWIGRDHAPIVGHPAGIEPYPVRPELPRFERRKWIVAAVIAAIAVAALLWSRYTRAPDPLVGQSQDNSVPVVSVTSPGSSAVTASISFTGALFARYDMPIGSDTDTGRIKAIYVEAGDHVKAGQMMAKLDESVLEPQVTRLAASLEESKAEAALSAAQYRRALGVQAAGALSAEEIEKRRASQVTDDAKVKVAAAQLAEAQARLDRTAVRAPADGLVLTRTAEVGQIASPGGVPLFRLAKNSEIEMRGQIAEQDMARLKIDQPAAVYITNVDKPFAGRVRLLGAVIDPLTRLGEIRIALGTDPVLRPGAFARGEVTIDHDQHPVLPQSAVLSDAKGSYVFIVNAKNEVERRDVQISDTTAAGVVIGAGLTGAERIVTTAAGFLREGEPVSAVSVPTRTP
jgi:RND family efflux transporter MFP subunit